MLAQRQSIWTYSIQTVRPAYTDRTRSSSAPVKRVPIAASCSHSQPRYAKFVAPGTQNVRCRHVPNMSHTEQRTHMPKAQCIPPPGNPIPHASVSGQQPPPAHLRKRVRAAPRRPAKQTKAESNPSSCASRKTARSRTPHRIRGPHLTQASGLGVPSMTPARTAAAEPHCRGKKCPSRLLQHRASYSCQRGGGHERFCFATREQASELSCVE